MNLLIRGHTFRYEMERLVMMFFPHEKINWFMQEILPQEPCVVSEICRQGDKVLLRADYLDSQSLSCTPQEQLLPTDTAEGELEFALGRLLYRLLCEQTGIKPPWGILTGIRPVKLLRDLYKQSGDEKAAQESFERDYLVSQQKTALAVETERRESPILAMSDRMDFSLYISIPFCPTRCRYCSFVSHGMDKARRLLPSYLAVLHRELRDTADIAKRLGLRLRTVYVGGGTPTVLEVNELDELLNVVAQNFDLSQIWEYTVEAGRPDTITAEKLGVMRAHGVGRVSVNPQTLRDDVLKNIGREHTAEQFLRSYELAVAAGFDCINVDLIAGLPGDDLEGFCSGMDKVISLAPQNITLHTLSVKRAAGFSKMREELRHEYGMAVDMVDYAYRSLAQSAYHPYYLYRQRGTAGNLENTGFSKEGNEGRYNVYIMAESQTILAAGAGAVSKIVHPENGQVSRIYNHKYPYEYIDRYEELLGRKSEIGNIYCGVGEKA